MAEAAADLEKAREFYETQESGAGEYFIDSILSDIGSLGLFHGIHPFHDGFYRMLASRFPFAIYYRECQEETQIFALLDLRRNPNWIREELGGR